MPLAKFIINTVKRTFIIIQLIYYKWNELSTLLSQSPIPKVTQSFSVSSIEKIFLCSELILFLSFLQRQGRYLTLETLYTLEGFSLVCLPP